MAIQTNVIVESCTAPNTVRNRMVVEKFFARGDHHRRTADLIENVKCSVGAREI